MSLPFIPAWLDDAGLSAAEFRIYCHLARRADNQTGIAWPSYEAVAEVCGLSRMTVARTLKALCDRKFIEKAGKPFGGSARYRLLPIVSPEARLEEPNSITTDTNGSPPIVSPEAINSITSDIPIVSPAIREGSPSKVPQRRKSKSTSKQQRSKISDDEFIESLRKDPENEGLDIDAELEKASAWVAKQPGRTFSRRFITNWMKRVDRPLRFAPTPKEQGPTDRVGDRQGTFEVIES